MTIEIIKLEIEGYSTDQYGTKLYMIPKGETMKNEEKQIYTTFIGWNQLKTFTFLEKIKEEENLK